MRVIIVGAGGTTRELLTRLGEAWEPVVVDPDPVRLEQARGLRKFEAIEGDGSSRVVLQKAGLDRADGFIAATSDDDTNLEACRLALEANVFRIAAVAADPERIPDYRQLGITAFSPAHLTARRLELELEPRRVASTAFAQGQAEAIEVQVAPDSPVQGRALKDLASPRWLVGAILRDGQLIIPHGDTVIRPGDLVTVVGSAPDFSEIVRTFTAAEARFPLDFGKQIVVYASGPDDLSLVGEAAHLTRNSLADELVVLHPESQDDLGAELLERVVDLSEGVEVVFRPVAQKRHEALEVVAAEGNVGVLVLAAPARFRRLRRPQAVLLARETGVPVLVSRGTHPYNRLLVPARRTAAGRAAGRAAIDLARTAKADLTGLAVVDPTFVSGQAGTQEARAAAGSLKQDAALQGVSVRRRIGRGNPVRVFLGFDADLLVVGLGDRAQAPIGVRVLDHLVRRFPASVLIVPAHG